MSKKISELPATTTLTDNDEVVVNHINTSGTDPETITSKMTVSNLKGQLGINGKAEKASGATSGNVATLDSNGNPVDSGKTLEKSVPSDAEFTDTQSDWSQNSTAAKDYIKNKPTLGTASAKDVPASGNASSAQVVMGSDTRLTDSRPASDVSAWAKASTKPSYTASEVGAIATTAKGAANGVAELDSTGKVPSAQLPSYVDDVIECYYYNSKFYSDSAHTTEITPETGKIYVDLSTDKTYRWSGTAYTQIKGDLALGETSTTAYRGDRGKTAYDHSQVTSGNPHNVSKSDVGLGNVVNTGDSATPVSGGTTKFTTGGAYTELAKKQDKLTAKGSATQGIYVDSNGALQTMTNTLAKSVPSDAVFTDTNNAVAQTNTTGSADYRLLLSANANDTTETTTARKSTNFKANPSTGELTAKKFSGVTINEYLTGTGTAGQDKGSGATDRYVPSKWTFNTGVTPADGDIITIKIPVAGGTYGVYISVDNGTTYKPVTLSGSSRFQTQYGKDVTLQLVYESAGTCTCYALNGSDSTSSVTGIWRVLNYYDSNTTYSKMSQSEANTGTATDARTMTASVLSTTINNKIAAIKQDGITGATVNRFGTCSTGASTAAKTVSVTSGTFSLEAGARVSVKFSNANTASTPTLNVGSTGAKNIYHKGSKITTGNNKGLLCGTVDFIYDGTQYHIIGADTVGMATDGSNASNSVIFSDAFTVGSRASGESVGSRSVAQGDNTIASESNSHAEGLSTQASGLNAHAEGRNTTARGGNSHAEGYHTTAEYDNQHVSGKYNNNKSDTLFEIGNGTSTSARSNALEVYSNGDLNITGEYKKNGSVWTPNDPNISDAWASGNHYVVGIYRIYNNTLYKCNTEHDSTVSNYPGSSYGYWTAEKVGEALASLNSGLMHNNIVLIREKEYTVNIPSDKKLYSVEIVSEAITQDLSAYKIVHLFIFFKKNSSYNWGTSSEKWYRGGYVEYKPYLAYTTPGLGLQFGIGTGDSVVRPDETPYNIFPNTFEGTVSISSIKKQQPYIFFRYCNGTGVTISTVKVALYGEP